MRAASTAPCCSRNTHLPDEDSGRKLRPAEPVRGLIARGIGTGDLRTDPTVDTLVEMFTGLLEKGLLMVLRGDTGAEQAGVSAPAVFLDGARPGTAAFRTAVGPRSAAPAERVRNAADPARWFPRRVC